MPKSRANKERMRGNNKKWMQDAFDPEKKGALHRALHIPTDKKIPVNKLEKATHSKDLKLRKRAILAQTARRINRKI